MPGFTSVQILNEASIRRAGGVVYDDLIDHSHGIPDAGKAIKLDGDGKIDESMLPQNFGNSEIISFDKDSSGAVGIKDLVLNDVIAQITIFVESPFDGDKAVEIGFPGNPGELISSGEINLAQAGIYCFGFYRNSNSPESLIATFSGMATMGSGKVIVEFL